jgi:hypothetical protein
MRGVFIGLIAACLVGPLHAQATAPAAAAGTEAPATPAAAPATDPEDLPLQPREGRAIAEALADTLLHTYVIPDNAKDFAAMLRANSAAGRYDTGTRAELARRLTTDLRAVHKDLHLHVGVAEADAAANGGDSAPGDGHPPPIQSAKTLAPGIAYIRFTEFSGSEEEVAAVRKWLEANRHAKTLIFDFRNHHGGGVDEQDLIFSYLFARRTPLVQMSAPTSIYQQGLFPFEPSKALIIQTNADQVIATHSAIPGEDTPLRRARIYVLTSNVTASAAEHFALAVKKTGRATLIGETTAGANHFGGFQKLGEHFNVWMPVGRTYDVDTGRDWEGTGIAPDVAVDPKLALVVALERAGLSHQEAVRLDSREIPAEPVHRGKNDRRVPLSAS